jgi:hypothetical protein
VAGRGQDPISARAQDSALLKGVAAVGEERNIAGKPGGERSIHIIEEKVFVVLSGEDDKDPRLWVLDTGASNHMMGSWAAFTSIDVGATGMVRFGDGSVVRIEGRGTILYQCKTGEHRALPNIYFIPRLDTNIISVGQLDEDGHEVKIQHGVMQIREEGGQLLARILRGPTCLYMLELSIVQPVCLSARTGDGAWRWHAQFGHTGFTALQRMGKEEMVRGLPVLEQVEQLYESCLAGKQRCAPFPHQSSRRTTKSLQLLHGDLCGPVTPPTPRGNRYFLLLVDDFSRYMWVLVISSKDQAASEIRRIQIAAEKKSGNVLCALRTD